MMEHVHLMSCFDFDLSGELDSVHIHPGNKVSFQQSVNKRLQFVSPL